MTKMTTTVAVVLSLLTALSAQPKESEGKGKGNHHEKMVQELNLTEEQQSEMKALKESQKGDKGTIHEEYKTIQSELDALLRQSNVDQKKIDAQIAKMAKLTTDKMNRRVAHLLEMKKILDENQFNKLLDMKKERMGKGHKGKGKGCKSDGYKKGQGQQAK